MKYYLLSIALFGLLMLSACGGSSDAPSTFQSNSGSVSKKEVLIVYDTEPLSPIGKLGMAYAIMLRNLIGHFDLKVDLLPVEDYTSGLINTYQSTFYIGSYFDNEIPLTFLRDVSLSQNTVVWFKSNIWQLTSNAELGFTERHGFDSRGLRGFDAPPSPDDPAPGFFDTVPYKSEELKKHYRYDLETGAVEADAELGLISITDPAKVVTRVAIKNSKTGEQESYIIQSGNFWYVADIPFSFVGPRDRYLVIADILHDILDVQHQEVHSALVRLEDINAKTRPQSVMDLADFLATKNIAFSLAVIPRYYDPFGVNNNGIAEDILFSDATALIDALKYAKAAGGDIVMHGYSHQYQQNKNPLNGMSGSDFEFWNIVDNRPVDGESRQSILQTLDQGLADLRGQGLEPYAWTTPHYQASPLSYKTFPERFATTYQRVVYYTSDDPDLNSTGAGKDFAVGQFFPYAISEDYYGQRVLPENIGNIQIDSSANASGPFSQNCADLLENVRYARLVRDGAASFFFHPFLLYPNDNNRGLEEFQCVINGISDLGFSWVAGPDFTR